MSVATSALLSASLLLGVASGESDGSVLLDVPFLPQGRLLCGGASAAMVLRYWGERDVYAEDFGHLVDEKRGGITTLDLVSALRARGWRALPVRADPKIVRYHLSRGRPLILLLREARNAFHYVVATGWDSDRLVIHDPSEGPLRSRTLEEMREASRATGFWSLLVLPPPPSSSEEEPAEPEPPELGDSPCLPLVKRALQHRDRPARASVVLERAVEECPADGLVARELAAVRFREKRFDDSARWAERAVALDTEDDHAWSILAASRFLLEEREEALAAWNERGEPRLDLVEIGGLVRTRQETIYRYLSPSPGEMLALDDLMKARRRLAELPTIDRSRASFEPQAGGRARLRVLASERKLFDVRETLFRGAVDAFVYRRARGGLASPTGGGELVEAGVRWWEERPSVRVTLTAPGMLGLPGVVTLEGFAERETFALGGTGTLREEQRRGAALSFSDWWNGSTRAELGAGFQRVTGRGEWLGLRAAIEHRSLRDRISLEASAARWFSAGTAAPFQEGGASLRARSSSRADPWKLHGRLDARLVSEEAPFSFWPGAGSDHARPLLLRGHPLLRGGVLSGDAFGRRLLHGSLEAERRLWQPGLASVGAATFFDWAMVWGQGAGEPRAKLYSVGGGVRLRLLGRALRLDAAVPLRGEGVTFSAGWVESW